MIEQAKFTHSPLGKDLEKEAKTIADQRQKQTEALRVLTPDVQQLTIKDIVQKNQSNEEAKNNIEKIKSNRKKS